MANSFGTVPNSCCLSCVQVTGAARAALTTLPAEQSASSVARTSELGACDRLQLSVTCHSFPEGVVYMLTTCIHTQAAAACACWYLESQMLCVQLGCHLGELHTCSCLPSNIGCATLCTELHGAVCHNQIAAAGRQVQVSLQAGSPALEGIQRAACKGFQDVASVSSHRPAVGLPLRAGMCPPRLEMVLAGSRPDCCTAHHMHQLISTMSTSF